MLRTLLSSIGLGFLISGCDSQPDYSSVLADLQRHGFFAHFTDAETEACTNIVREKGWDALYEEHPRFYWASIGQADGILPLVLSGRDS